MTPLRKLKRRLRNGDLFRRPQLTNVVFAVACIFVGYLIAVVSDTTHEAFRELKEIESVVSDVGDVKSIDELKRKVKSNPGMLDKLNPSMIKKFESNLLLKKQIEKKMKELK